MQRANETISEMNDSDVSEVVESVRDNNHSQEQGMSARSFAVSRSEGEGSELGS